MPLVFKIPGVVIEVIEFPVQFTPIQLFFSDIPL